LSDGGGGVRRDEALVAYVEAIEAALRVRRGTDHALSPRDFALVRGWHDGGVPLATVLVAIDLAFDADPGGSGLAVVRRRVDELAAHGPRPPGALRDTERASLPEVAERLAALRERLLELPGHVAAVPLGEVEAVADLVAVASRPNWDYLRERLRRVDEVVAAAAADALSPEEAQVVRAEAGRSTERHRGRVEPRSLEDAVARFVRQRARERLRLPRVSID
jgi:hypothetical protein